MPPSLQPTIALTFDDGPDSVSTPRVLNALREVDAKATFFVCAPAALEMPDTLEAILGDGHAIGFHCNEHVRHSRSTRAEIETDTERGLETLAGLGIRPRLWRTPWGDLAPFTEELARSHDLAIAGWTEDTHDWRGDSASEILDAIGPSVRSGSVVLMHDGLGPGALRDGCPHTEALIAPLVELARGRGLKVRTLEEPGTSAGRSLVGGPVSTVAA